MRFLTNSRMIGQNGKTFHLLNDWIINWLRLGERGFLLRQSNKESYTGVLKKKEYPKSFKKEKRL
jgi:hypothetical protein